MKHEAFEGWEKAVDEMITQSEKAFMPLLASTFRLSKEVLNMYAKAYKTGIKK